MSELDKKPKFGHEMRLLAASLLSMGVILLWTRFFAPKPPIPPPQANRPAQTAPATPGNPATPSSTNAPTAMPKGTVTGISGSTPAPVRVAAKSDTLERTIVVENDLYRVEFSNRGAVVKSWQLKKYLDDSKPQRVLDVVHPDAAQQTGGWPFALVLDDEEMQSAANGGLYHVSSPANNLRAPAEAEFSWSDGHLEVTKHFRFDHTYVVRVETSVKMNGAPVTAGLGWLGGFGDLTVLNPAPIDTVSVFYTENGKITDIAAEETRRPREMGPAAYGKAARTGPESKIAISPRLFCHQAEPRRARSKRATGGSSAPFKWTAKMRRNLCRRWPPPRSNPSRCVFTWVPKITTT